MERTYRSAFDTQEDYRFCKCDETRRILVMDEAVHWYSVNRNYKQAKLFTAHCSLFNEDTTEGLTTLINDLQELFTSHVDAAWKGMDGVPVYQVGREYSRVIYVRVARYKMRANTDWEQIKTQMKAFGEKASADESMEEKLGDGEFCWRFWWD